MIIILLLISHFPAIEKLLDISQKTSETFKHISSQPNLLGVAENLSIGNIPAKTF